ncbi:MAG: N,N-dimethylformamidase large subunit [Alphaproteobacteria bacterium]|nr:N,N-dimethylformamidase large subunit [Alphaproteobacteria bacterium]
MAAPLIGYVDRFSARPGERIAVKVSSQREEPYDADLVRIIHGDPNPAGTGIKLKEIAAAFAGPYSSRFQPVHSGSCGVVTSTVPIHLPDPCTIVIRVQPWLLDGRPQTVLAIEPHLTLSVAAEGATLEAQGRRLQVSAPMLKRRWYELRVIAGDGALRLRQTALQRSWGVADSGEAEMPGTIGALSGVVFGARIAERPHPHDDPYAAFFNGRIEDPAVLAGAVATQAPIDPSRSECLAWWDFSAEIPTERFVDRGPNALHGRLRNLPTRAVHGSRWTGEETNWRHMPRQYAAIHFHEDDLYDCGWQTDFEVAIPHDMPSSVYGVRLRCGGFQDIVPFYVLPPRGRTSALIAFLASTFTYQVYGNHRRGNVDDAFRERQTDWGAYPWNADDHPEYAGSTYNTHPDGSGVCYSSLRRPLLTMRPGYVTYFERRGSGLRHFPADTHLVDWLTVKGIDFDVITDHDLDREGVALLQPYRAVVTGSHPEYHTPNTLNALQGYVDGAGRLAYLGGNGFYWRVANSAAIPDVLEIRRAEGGIRTWAAEPGEYFHALDGGYGGLWRRNGRPPQLLCGVGFSAQGLFEGSYYRRMPAADDPRASWIFDGIDDEIIGDFGLSGGGAAGFELDRADVELGTPPNALILARSEQHQRHFGAVPEEYLTHVTTVTGESPKALIRAEIVYFETVSGGAVFSTGSITFCGSLSHNNYDNNVSRMLENVLRRFATE